MFPFVAATLMLGAPPADLAQIQFDMTVANVSFPDLKQAQSKFGTLSADQRKIFKNSCRKGGNPGR